MSSQALVESEAQQTDQAKGREHDPALANLVRAAVAGESGAWESLVNRFTPALRATARGFKLSSADVDDVVQETWLAAVRYLGRLENPAAIGAWLLVIARREALRLLQRHTQEDLTDEPPEPPQPSAESPESLAVEADERERVRAAVWRLPDRQRKLLKTLIGDPTVSYLEISRRLEMPIGSIGPTRDRAIDRLRRDRELAGAVRVA
jgi:RNA polymerase sigma factor (sigma-70 family)